MQAPSFHLVQLNIARPKEPVDSGLLAPFVALLDPVIAVADAAVPEAEERLTCLREHGPTRCAFTFKQRFDPGAYPASR